MFQIRDAEESLVTKDSTREVERNPILAYSAMTGNRAAAYTPPY